MHTDEQSVLQFLHNYCTRVRSNESIAHVELMMNTDHKCIDFKGRQWYVKENISFLTADETTTHEHILNTFAL